jgi:glycogen(starch) synthase
MTPPGTMRRILMTTDAVGGVWGYALTLAGGLAASGVNVMLATMGPLPSVAQRAQVAALPGVTLRESEFRLEWMQDPWADVERAAGWLLELEQEFAPDVVHLNGFVHAAVSWRAPVVVAAHSCVLSWWRAVRGGEAPAEWEDYRNNVLAGLHSADAVVAPTRAMLNTIEQNYGRLADAVVIPNGCDPRSFYTGRKEPFVLSAGRLWDEAKNVRALVAVAPELAWPVQVAGDSTSPDGRACEQLANVTALGFCPPEAMARLYARAAVYALPARYEPFGLSALEAALSGCALVLGDIPSLRELWHDAAVFVAPTDRFALRHALNAVIEHDKWREELAARANLRAQFFTARRMVAAYRDLYRSLGRRRAPSRPPEVLSA